MKNGKTALSYEEQAQELLDRALIAPDKAALAKCHSVLNHYRLSAYRHPFKRIDPVAADESFAPSTTLYTFWQHYTFDRELCLVAIDDIERGVTILRTDMTTHLTTLDG